ncbi:lycopene cyclase family protein [Flavobacterium litorale]|uniref:Lycopene cyclase n=1 Tax=Flavobacterium litorale TaxID=2856519 RepID=A0ABX8VDB0_9FLAO|nr:lycopene cyclase family protein [Flavobacterium litorale]QYJ69148.1 lycopene cyclase [Flavobacterium litorale]
MKHYHYIFAGAGLSALITVYRMAVSGKFSDKNILLIDADAKKSNDRTWCYWETGAGEWDAIVSKKWDNALFASSNFRKNMVLAPYSYKMIKGATFYQHVFNTVSKHSNITFVQQKVVDFSDASQHVLVKTETENYTCNKLFNSIYNPNFVHESNYQLVQQHFIGWFVKTKKPVFSSGMATFMDFSVPQLGNTRFMYVLPTSEKEALVEYTLFSPNLLEKQEYENAIREYLKNLGVNDGGYEIVEKEAGNIPMTCYPFWKNNSKNIVHIGSAGGWTKASTGYTFKNTTKKSEQLVNYLQQPNPDFTKLYKKNRFWLYDLLLIDILYRTNEKGSSIFSAMFKKENPQLIFKFLDEETTFAEELKVILSCPKLPFIQALGRKLVLK